jgi:hypothetical protein
MSTQANTSQPTETSQLPTAELEERGGVMEAVEVGLTAINTGIALYGLKQHQNPPADQSPPPEQPPASPIAEAPEPGSSQ